MEAFCSVKCMVIVWKQWSSYLQNSNRRHPRLPSSGRFQTWIQQDDKSHNPPKAPHACMQPRDHHSLPLQFANIPHYPQVNTSSSQPRQSHKGLLQNDQSCTQARWTLDTYWPKSELGSSPNLSSFAFHARCKDCPVNCLLIISERFLRRLQRVEHVRFRIHKACPSCKQCCMCLFCCIQHLDFEMEYRTIDHDWIHGNSGISVVSLEDEGI